MILFTNGTGHTAGAQAVNEFIMADDDRMHWSMGRAPHPDNVRVSWGAVLAGLLKFQFMCNAEEGQSNNTIMKSTLEWIDQYSNSINPEDVIIILDWNDCSELSDADGSLNDIFDFHNTLTEKGFKHVFFNSKGSYVNAENHKEFGSSFIDPYLAEGSFDGFLQTAGHNTIVTSNRFYGQNAHSAWAKHLVQHISRNKLV